MRENRPPVTQPKPQPEQIIEKPDSPKPVMSPADNVRVTVKQFHFSGNSEFSDAQLSPLLNAYLGHEITFKDLEAAAKRIADYYHEAGFFLTSAYIPQQVIKGGHIEITILEGRLDNTHLTTDVIEALDELRINHAVLQRFLEPYAEGELLTVEDLSHLSLLINDLPQINGKIVLTPSKQTGRSSLTLKVKEDSLLKGYGLFDNNGMYATGYYRFEGGLSVNDPFGWGDQLNMRVQTTDSGNMVSGGVDYNAPLNGYGTRLVINFSELHYSLGRSFTPLQAQGLARTVGVSVTHPFWLAREGRLTGTAHYEHRWMLDNMKQYSLLNDRELNVMSFSLAGNYYDQLFLPAGGVTQGYLSVSAGEVRFNSPEAFARDQSNGLKSNGGYHKFFWQVNRTQNINENISLFANFQGQLASKNIDTSEHISLGGPSAIRAYPVGEGSGDEGWLFTGETRYRLPSLPYVPGYLQFVGFFDTGYSRTNTKPLAGDLHNARHLTGYGVGLNLLEAKGFNVRTSVAWHDNQKHATSDTTAQCPTVYFQLSKSF